MLQGDEEEDEDEELRAKLEAAMAARMKKIKDVNKLENRDKEMMVYSPSDNIKNNQEKGYIERSRACVYDFCAFLSASFNQSSFHSE